MIITVTLNAAIDKTLEVPNFTPGRRHRTVDQRTMPGGKGVNIARAIKRLGQPVIATGFAGGATGTRIVEALDDESILNDFVRIREESRTNTAVLDPTTGMQTEINERGPAVIDAGARAVPREAALPGQGREHLRVRRQPAARRRARRLRRADPRGAPARRDDDDRHRRRAAAARRPGRARRRLAQRARGRGARRPRVQRRRRPRPGGGRDDPARRPRGDHDRVRRLLRAGARGRRAGAVPRHASRSRRRARGRLGRRVPGRLRRRALRGPDRRSTACASGSPAAPSRPSTSAPGSSIRPRSSGCSARSSAERVRASAPRSAERGPALRRAAERPDWPSDRCWAIRRSAPESAGRC